MDPQPQPPPTTTTTTTPATPPPTTTPTPTTTPYPDSIDSSPRSRTTESYFDDPPPPSSLPSKLRLMCSYDGHIVPRPHDKSLCYVGGDTRIVVVDRNVSLHSLSSRLSSTILNNRPFTLKYQLPNEDLDSLISVTTDEDLENMIDEYDRTNAVKSRLRLFLFPLIPDSSQSLGPMIENSIKNEDWFVDALNGATECLNRGFSDSASVNCLLGLDDEGLNGQNGQNLEFSGGGGGGGAGAGGGGDVEGVKRKQGQDVHSVPDSPMLETTSSFGSTSSSPSLANLPPIKVHVDEGVTGGGGGAGGGAVRVFANDQKLVGIEEQFSQISVGGGVGQKQDDGFGMISPPPPLPVSFAVPGMAMGAPVVVGEFHNRVVSDDERSDHGVPVGYRKPPQPQTLGVQTQQKSSAGGDVPSPDSVSSDSSFSNTVSRQKPATYQDQVIQMAQGVSRAVTNQVDSKINMSDLNTRVQIQQQVTDSGYVLQPQFDQQQQQQQHFIQQQPQFDQQQQQQQHFIQQRPQFDQHQQQQQHFIQQQPHYIHHNPTGTVPISAYYPVYPPPQQQHLPQQHHPQLDQQYPVYYVQARHPQAAYNIPMQQSNIGDASVTVVPSSRPQTPPNPVVMPSSTAQNPVRNVPVAKPEMGAAGMYRQVTTATPQFVQVPSSQHQQQYIGYSQVHHPSQSVVPTAATGATNYAYDYAESAHAQVYYTQPLVPPLPSQYQTMTAGAAVVPPEASSQLPTETIKQQQIRTSQPI